MVKKKEAPVADAARAGTGNTNRSPSLASQTIENQHTNRSAQAPWQEELATGTAGHEHNAQPSIEKTVHEPPVASPEPAAEPTAQAAHQR